MKILRGYTTLLAAALVASVAPMAHATLYSSVGISTSTTGELTSPSYSGVSNQFSSEANGYNFVYAAGSVGGSTCGVATCANSVFGSSNVGMWAIPTNTTILGANGAFLALDSDYTNPFIGYVGAPVTDSITGLTAGDIYTITFNTADAQQNTYTGESQDYVQVCFLGSCQNTANAIDTAASGGSSDDTPWVAQSFTFTATSSNISGATLTFLGVGGSYPTLGSNVPAFALVDDLSITQTQAPEPSSLMLLGTGLAGLGGLVRSRFSKKA